MYPKIKAVHNRFVEIQELSREAGLTALLIVQVVFIFVVVPLTAMNVIPQLVVPATFAVLVLAILLVTSRSYYVSALVVVAVVLSPAGAFVHADHPAALTECLSAGGRMLALAALSWVIARAVFRGSRVTLHRCKAPSFCT